MKDLIEAFQTDAGLRLVRLTREQWLRSRSRVCLWFLELNSVTKQPASLTFCRFEPCRKTLAVSPTYNNISQNNTTEEPHPVLKTNLQIDTFGFNFLHVWSRLWRGCSS